MDLAAGEKVLKVYHHHPTPFVIDILKVVGVIFPFYLALFVLQEVLPMVWFLGLHIILFLSFSLAIIYFSVIFWLDRLIVTSERLVYINYVSFTKRNEVEAFLKDVIDIETKERGFLATFKFLDYGTVTINTPSSYISFIFPEAPDPEGIRQYIYHVKQN